MKFIVILTILFWTSHLTAQTLMPQGVSLHNETGTTDLTIDCLPLVGSTTTIECSLTITSITQRQVGYDQMCDIYHSQRSQTFTRTGVDRWTSIEPNLGCDIQTTTILERTYNPELSQQARDEYPTWLYTQTRIRTNSTRETPCALTPGTMLLASDYPNNTAPNLTCNRFSFSGYLVPRWVGQVEHGHVSRPEWMQRRDLACPQINLFSIMPGILRRQMQMNHDACIRRFMASEFP